MHRTQDRQRSTDYVPLSLLLTPLSGQWFSALRGHATTHYRRYKDRRIEFGSWPCATLPDTQPYPHRYSKYQINHQFKQKLPVLYRHKNLSAATDSGQ